MTLTLYQHPLASFCHKVLLALYENETPFESRVVDLSDPAQVAELQSLWAVGKIPVLRDHARDRNVAETSIIIEYLAQHYPGPVALFPAAPEEALEARLWDRFFDLYVQTPMQKIVGDLIRPPGTSDPHGVREAHAALQTAYDMLEKQLATGPWAVGKTLSIADLAAAPALFYAHIVEPFGAAHIRLAAYFDRLVERPAFQRVLDEARPYFSFFPLREKIPARFLVTSPARP